MQHVVLYFCKVIRCPFRDIIACVLSSCHSPKHYKNSK